MNFVFLRYRIKQILSENSLLVGVLVLLCSAFMIGSLGGFSVSGDTRGLTDQAWWFSKTGSLNLHGHSAYPAGQERYGYWAHRIDEETVVSVYPPANSAIAGIGLWLLTQLGMDINSDNLGDGLIIVCTLLMAISTWCIWYSLVLKKWFVSALVCAIFFSFGTLIPVHPSKGLWTQTGAIFSFCVSVVCFSAIMHRFEKKLTFRFLIVCCLLGFFAVLSVFCRPPFLLWFLIVSAAVVIKQKTRSTMFFCGAFVGLIIGLWINQEGAGSMTGSYVSKATDQAGFTMNPLDITNAFLGIMFSPGRGLLLFSPWVLFSFISVVYFWKRWHRIDLFLTANLLFFAAMIGVLSAFKQWHGGFGLGPRLQLDMVASAAIIAAPVIRYYSKSIWGWAIVVLLGAPSLYVNTLAADFARFIPDPLYDQEEHSVFERAWMWENSAYQWIVSNASDHHKLLKGDEPLMTSNTISYDSEGAQRFIKSGFEMHRYSEGFYPLTPRARLHFIPPTGIDSIPELALFVDLTAFRSSWMDYRPFTIKINGSEVMSLRYLTQYHRSQVAVNFDSSIIKPGEVNVIELINHNPGGIADLRPLMIGIRKVSFYPYNESNAEQMKPFHISTPLHLKP